MLNTLFGGLFAVSAALAESAGTTTGAEVTEMGTGAMLVQTLVPMVLIVAVFYFFMIRPQKKKDKKVKDMLAALKVGDRICTIGGIYGTITAIKDDTVTLAVGKEKTTLVMARWSIRNVEEVAVENDSEVLA